MSKKKFNQRKLHVGLLVFWVLMIFPSVLWLSRSVPYLVALSVYAIIAAHWVGATTPNADGK